MAPNILITGASGYLGGSLLQLLKDTSPLPANSKVYALVRSEEQAKQVKTLYNATPITLSLSDEGMITNELLEKEITVVFYLIDAVNFDPQLRLIRALEAVGEKLEVQTHFLHTTGAKLFSSFVGHPTDRPLSDAEEGLFKLQKTSRGPFDMMNKAVATNNAVIEAAKAHNVRSYIFIPCIVYGEGTGFGNKISIQTVAIVQAAKAVRRVYKPDDLSGASIAMIWPVSHIHDNTTLYADLLHNILAGKEIGYNESGYYLASSGTIAWSDLYTAMAKALLKRGVIDSAEVGEVNDEVLEKAAKALGCSKEFVPVQIGGACTLQADRGKTIGWSPKYSAEHILEAAEEEVELILSKL